MSRLFLTSYELAVSSFRLLLLIAIINAIKLQREKTHAQIFLTSSKHYLNQFSSMWSLLKKTRAKGNIVFATWYIVCTRIKPTYWYVANSNNFEFIFIFRTRITPTSQTKYKSKYSNPDLMIIYLRSLSFNYILQALFSCSPIQGSYTSNVQEKLVSH